MQRYGAALADDAHTPYIRKWKESHGYVSMPPRAVAPRVTVALPSLGGRALDFEEERWRSAEALFTAELHPSLGLVGLPAAIEHCLQAADVGSRPRLVRNILLSGGTACLPGLPSRLQHEVAALSSVRNTDGSAAARVIAPRNCVFSSWMGAAKLAGEDFSRVCVDRDEWEEEGDRLFDTP